MKEKKYMKKIAFIAFIILLCGFVVTFFTYNYSYFEKINTSLDNVIELDNKNQSIEEENFTKNKDLENIDKSTTSPNSNNELKEEKNNVNTNPTGTTDNDSKNNKSSISKNEVSSSSSDKKNSVKKGSEMEQSKSDTKEKNNSKNTSKKETTDKSTTQEKKKKYIGVPDPNNFNYSFHKGKIDCKTQSLCLKASIEISFLDEDITNSWCMEVVDEENQVLGYFLQINSVSKNYVKHKENVLKKVCE